MSMPVVRCTSSVTAAISPAVISYAAPVASVVSTTIALGSIRNVLARICLAVPYGRSACRASKLVCGSPVGVGSSAAMTGIMLPVAATGSAATRL